LDVGDEPLEIKKFSLDANLEAFSKFCSLLEETGYKNFRMNAFEQLCLNLSDILQFDFKNHEISKRAMISPRDSLFVNAENKAVVLVQIESRIGRSEDGLRFIVTCFSDNAENAQKALASLRQLVEEKAGVAKEKINDGDSNEIANRRLINNLSKTPRSELVSQISPTMLEVFLDGRNRKSLRDAVVLPFKVFPEAMFEMDAIGKLDVDLMVSTGIFEEMFSPTCKKCEDKFGNTSFLLDSKEEIYPILEKQVIVCPTCGSKLGKDNSNIMRYLRFSKSGSELSKGLWLEAYIFSLLCEIGIQKEGIAVCATHDKDEVDAVFSDGRYLYVLECKDKIVGQNDVYVLAMKANRVSGAKLGARVDKVLMVSTETISKDIMPEEKTYDDSSGVDYIPISGEPAAIKEKLSKLILESFEEQRELGVRQLLGIVIGRIPSSRRLLGTVYRPSDSPISNPLDV
jgi:DNA-directed RNA polymerase subunit RPC12/RpoP